jgi:hypothetical protein
MDFADNVLPSLNLLGKKDHCMTAFANSAISDDVAVLEKLGTLVGIVWNKHAPLEGCLPRSLAAG